jgi:hypothetical protein
MVYLCLLVYVLVVCVLLSYRPLRLLPTLIWPQYRRLFFKNYNATLYKKCTNFNLQIYCGVPLRCLLLIFGSCLTGVKIEDKECVLEK